MKNNSKNSDDWLVPEFERSCKKTWDIFFLCIVLIVGLAVAYLFTLNSIFQWIAMFPAGAALYCLGYQGALTKADDYIRDFASQVAVILDVQLDGIREGKNESIKSR